MSNDGYVIHVWGRRDDDSERSIYFYNVYGTESDAVSHAELVVAGCDAQRSTAGETLTHVSLITIHDRRNEEIRRWSLATPE